jgi:hypothetical protein
LPNFFFKKETRSLARPFFLAWGEGWWTFVFEKEEEDEGLV